MFVSSTRIRTYGLGEPGTTRATPLASRVSTASPRSERISNKRTLGL